MQAHGLLILDEDVKSRSWADWLIAHTSFAKPLHRYDGIIALKNDGLYFTGFDKRNKHEVEIVILKHHISSISYGYDNVYSVNEVRGLGITWKPIRITFNEIGETQHIYIIINYNLGRTDNENWFTLLQHWLS